MGYVRRSCRPTCCNMSFRPRSAKLFTQKTAEGTGNVNKSSFLLENSILWEVLSSCPDVSVQLLIIFNSSNSFLIRVIWIYSSIGLQTTRQCFFYAVWPTLFILSWSFLCINHECSECYQMLRRERDIHRTIKRRKL